MNDVPDRAETPPKMAQAQLDHLNGQVAAMRMVLVQLLQEVVVAETRLDRSQATQLIEANENLVVSALGAQTAAETANGALDEASRAGGLDALTGLPNRTVLLDRFETAIFNAKRHGNRVALLFLDLDGFKQINDSYGHATGDHALQLVADCLSSLVRETDTVSRHGGDEFLMLLGEVTHASDAELVAEKVHAALAEYRQLDEHPVQLRASIGICVYPDDGLEAKSLIEYADAAMYRAKKQGPGRVERHHVHPRDLIRSLAASNDSEHQPLAPELSPADQRQHQQNLREANEKLVLASLGARDLLAAAVETRRRQSELLAMVAEELSSPYAPIRLAASTLGIAGVETTLLRQAQTIIEEQADKLSRTVRDLLEQQGQESQPPAEPA